VFQPSDGRKAGTDDNVDALIALVGQLVHFDSWWLGRVQGKTVVSFACAPTDDEDGEVKRFYACYRRQQRRVDPRAISVVHDSVFPHAVTMTLSAPDGSDVMLVLLRGALVGEFTDYDYRLLALAKGLCEECLASGFVAAESEESSAEIHARARPVLFILDRSYKIVMGHRAEAGDPPDLAGFSPKFADRLPQVLEDAVRRLTADWAKDAAHLVNGVTTPLPFLSLRVHSLEGAEEHFLAVTIERMRRRDILLRAAKRYLITPREREVVAYLLDGMRIDEIAACLNIVPSTVNDHVKRLIERTGAANRSQMLAHILGWQSKTASKARADAADEELAVRR
jgi:DNA-binding CsgD family transcriptional regulator